MARRLGIFAAAAVLLIAAPAAHATTQTASAGGVTATFRFQGKAPNFHGLQLTIDRGGTVVYDQPVVAKLCGTRCWPIPLPARKADVQVIDLEHTGEPDVVLNLYSGGAHCCGVMQIFSFDPAANTYVPTERNFGDPGTLIVDLLRNGRYELLTTDDSFAHRFTDLAASGLPIEVLTFANRRFMNVTRSWPQVVAANAAVWLKLFKDMARDHYSDSVGVIAAWAADEDLLGRQKLVSRYLSQQARAGHLNAPFRAGGTEFVAKLQKFLRRRGYLR